MYYVMFKSIESESKHKIQGQFELLDAITNFKNTVEQQNIIRLHSNHLFDVTLISDKTTVGQISPLVMKLNQYGDWNHPHVQQFLEFGANPNMQMNYYGRRCSAKDIFPSS